MEKYYTPTIDEFYIGYECEWKVNGREWSVKYPDICYNWNKHKIEIEDFYSNDFDIEEHNINNNTLIWRTKYLDDEDLNELGFTKIGKNIRYGYIDYVGDNSKIDLSKVGYYCYITFHKCRVDDEHLIMFHRYNPTTRNIEEDLKEFESEIRFRGNIRCKNELKTILKFLNVN